MFLFAVICFNSGRSKLYQEIFVSIWFFFFFFALKKSPEHSLDLTAKISNNEKWVSLRWVVQDWNLQVMQKHTVWTATTGPTHMYLTLSSVSKGRRSCANQKQTLTHKNERMFVYQELQTGLCRFFVIHISTITASHKKYIHQNDTLGFLWANSQILEHINVKMKRQTNQWSLNTLFENQELILTLSKYLWITPKPNKAYLCSFYSI